MASLPGDSWYEVSTDLTKTGYVPLGVVGVKSTYRGVYPYWFSIEGQTLRMGVATKDGSGIPEDAFMTCFILYAKLVV